MGNRFTHKFQWKRVLLTNVPLALVIAVFTYSLSNDATLADVVRYFCTAFVYSFSIGCLAHGLMPYLWAWSLSKPAVLSWPLPAVALTVLAAVGCSIASGLLVAGHRRVSRGAILESLQTGPEHLRVDHAGGGRLHYRL